MASKKPSSRLGKLMARFSDSSTSSSNKKEPVKKRTSLKRIGKDGASDSPPRGSGTKDVGWGALTDSPRAAQESISKPTRSSDKEITTPKAVTVASSSNGNSNSDDEEISMSTVLPRNMKCVRLSHASAVRGIDAESSEPSSQFPLVKGKGVKSKKAKANGSPSEGSSPEGPASAEKPTQSDLSAPEGSIKDPNAAEKSEPAASEELSSAEQLSLAVKVKVDMASFSSEGGSEKESAFDEGSPEKGLAPQPRSTRSVSNPVTPMAPKREQPPVDADGFATPTMTMRSTPKAKSRVANTPPPSTLPDSLKRSKNMFSSRKSSYESALAMKNKSNGAGRSSKNADMEELDTLRRSTSMSNLKRSLTDTWGKRVADAEEEKRSTSRHGTPKSSTLGAPKGRMKRSPSLVLRAMSQRYLETAKSETEFKRRKSEFAVRRKAGIRTLDEDKKKKATEVIEKNMVYKSKVGKEGMLSEYIQACDPAHLQDLIDRGLIEAQATNDNGEIDVSKIESNEFNLNNNEFMGRLGREQFEDKVHEIVDFVAENKQIKILSLTNAGVDTYFGIQIARMMLENEHITELNLESNDIYEQGIELLADVIRKNKSLKILKLTNQKRYPSHTAKNALIKALEGNHEIIRFSYDFMTIQQNDLRDKYLHRNQKWSRHKNRMAPTKSPTLVSSRRRRTVMERVSTAKQNSELDIALQRYSQASESQVKFDLSQMSAHFRRLTDLQMVDTISKIEAIINGNPLIERVIFKNSGVHDKLGRAIAKCVAAHKKVRELNLEANDLSSDFLIELCDILGDNTVLQVLNVRHQRKDPSRAVATRFVKFLEKNHTILRMGFKFTQTREEHLKERYLKRNAKEWRTERAIRKAEEEQRQRMLEEQGVQEDEEEDEEKAQDGDGGQSDEKGEGEEIQAGQLQSTLGGLTVNVADTDDADALSQTASPLMSPMARDRHGRELSWDHNMERVLDKLMPATPKGARRTPTSPSAASSVSALSSLDASPAVTPKAQVLSTDEKSESAEANGVDDSSKTEEASASVVDPENNKSDDSSVAKPSGTTPMPLGSQPSFTQFSLNFSALAAEEDEDDAEAEGNATDEDENAADAEDDAAASIDYDEEAPVAADEAPAMMEDSDDED